MAFHFTPWAEAMLPPRQTVVPLPPKIGIAHQLPPPEIIWLDTAESTHMLLKSADYADLEPYKMVAARRQTAGRGQRGNSWEAEPFKNLTFSLVVRPTHLHPNQQFTVSEATALAVVALLQGEGIEASVKWPNDIYVADRKICGILIDHAVDGTSILRSIVSAGINVNQREFRSDAPNPASMWQILGRESDLESLGRHFMLLLRQFMTLTESAAGRGTLHESFLRRLYRFDGKHYRFRDINRGLDFEGVIEDVAPDGILRVRDAADGTTRGYRFKEIGFIIQD